MRITISRLALLGLAATMVSCSGGGYSDLDEYMAEVKAVQPQPIEPVPTFDAYKPFNYAATALRHPFEIPRPVDPTEEYVEPNQNVKPIEGRRPEHLEQFNLESLSFVGTWEQYDDLWALVDDGQGGVHPVKEGNYLGRNHGKIVDLSEMEIKIVEIVRNGQKGWIERPRSLELRESGL